jgi:cell division protein FtsB
MPLLKLNRSQLAAIVAIIAVLAAMGIIVWGFAQQLALARQLYAEEKRLEQAVATEQAHHEELVARLEYVRSDEYVEYWARTEAHMAKPGEMTVVLVDDSEEPVTETAPAPSPESEEPSFWAELWELVFGPTTP